MYFYPKRTNHHALISVVLLYLLAATCVVGIVLEKGSAIVWQVMGGTSALLAVLFTNRYLLTRYLYALTPIEDLHVKNALSIVRVMGKKRKILALVNLQSVKAFLPASELLDLLVKRGVKRFVKMSFCPDLFPENAWAIYTENGEEGAAVLIQCDQAMVSELKSRIPGGE